ncbi:MAG: hypothetical protein KDB67_06325 [Gordonia sp.]|jgi:hypothetical protein|uniref:phage minor head protein n=1 Tax=Gordonia sp. (in: high G+C Gram-positive bacteria) TaxID=84139 RepID=UPI001D9028FF|nr:phage minor head protein [Gordonia sp. (in: high G+C Gram-positive bacteria)]MCB1294286.1 hypothetical protein [Gordonia sp. (in: high G+C Gram-positive bacteria)]HQV19918.1 phage minor head protein [Gordonia sp. (in: high G+C Gram-positive bacteria)]
MAAEKRLARAEERVEAAVVTAMRDWLAAVRVLILAEVMASTSEGDKQRKQFQVNVTSAGYPDHPSRAVDAASAAYNDWRRSAANNVLPAVSIAYGEAFAAIHKSTPGSSYRPQQEYLATVSDRLRIWPEGAFEELRPELLEALSESETIEEVTDRVGRVLNIDAGTRALRAEIGEVDRKLADPDLPAWRRESLTARRRSLWRAHDESLSEWRWKARRIARTETHGAVNSGQLAAAIEMEAATGDTYYKRWLATEDTRTRAAHRVADGQTVPLRGKFRVGGWLLDFPGDPVGPGHLSINCRCTMILYDADAVQDALQGPDGSLGEIRPGGVRLGTDDADKAAEAIRKVAEDEQRALPANPEDRGEDHGQPAPPPDPVVELTDEREAPVAPRLDDFSRYSDDELLEALGRSVFADDPELYEALNREWDRRSVLTEPVTESTDDLTESTEDVTEVDPEMVALLGDLDDDDLREMIEDAREVGDTDLLEVLQAERNRRRGLTAGGKRRRALKPKGFGTPAWREEQHLPDALW